MTTPPPQVTIQNLRPPSLLGSSAEMVLTAEQTEIVKTIAYSLDYIGNRYTLCNFSSLRNHASFTNDADRANFDATLFILKDVTKNALEGKSPTAVTEFAQKAWPLINELLGAARASRDIAINSASELDKPKEDDQEGSKRYTLLCSLLDNIKKDPTKYTSIGSVLSAIKIRLHKAQLMPGLNFTMQEQTRRQIGFAADPSNPVLG